MPHPTRHRHLAVAALAILAIAGCTPSTPPTSGPSATVGPSGVPVGTTAPAASPSPAADASVAPAQWHDCGKGFQCAALPVPRDYADPSRGTMTVEIIRLPATDRANRIGALVMDPGGPGASGIEFVRDGASSFPRELRRKFDLVGFDPRGVNASSPIRCIDNLDERAAVDPSPDDPSELAAIDRDARAFAAACAARNAQDLPYISTDAVARDLDRIRAALGEAKLTYLGFSYGTLIGSTYAGLFPTKIRAMALDGAIDPALDLQAFRTGQAKAFEASLHVFLADCAADRTCPFYEGGHSAKAFDALMARIDAKPLPAPHSGDIRKVGPGLAASAVLGAMYSDTYWPTLAAGLELAKRGDGSILLLISDPFRGRKENGAYSNLQDAYTANTCLDYPAPKNLSTYTSWAKSLKSVAPHFAGQIAYNDLPCAYWSAAAERTPAPISAKEAPPIVVVGSTGDPATPYGWAVSLSHELSSGVLITRKGEGHTGYQASGCVRDAVDAYLLTLKVPRAGLTC